MNSQSCILSKFYIKPQLYFHVPFTPVVVSYRNSTSNHNRTPLNLNDLTLYLIEILHQTTTPFSLWARRKALYLIEILHQTTTCGKCEDCLRRCILSKFYIKPQLRLERELSCCVVSYRNSTSNHNYNRHRVSNEELYLIEILHQTTTLVVRLLVPLGCILSKFYIKPQPPSGAGLAGRSCILSKFYIKPQQSAPGSNHDQRCILSKFYIKPQLAEGEKDRNNVVSYRNSTSNHNITTRCCSCLRVVSYRNSTSNHNRKTYTDSLRLVVSYRNSTSNHNPLVVLHFNP